ncbi:hypothetical protein CALVIDRAFT_565503 [Calocera viscosa TUFC12733]|uniref:ABM domain-containing protein n=1 Tax=Calocera viscosa (strain TUFC12733) TaxID=1330018 RepID=A0A167KLG1_CALVF|nr:hypothetical protein CALVIDRAFT_565503 [Calocera viscosa TUFC12733]
MSSEEQLSYSFEVIFLKPNKADPAGTRGKTAAGFEVQRKHEDFVRYALEGVKVEDDSVVLRILQWTSYDGHMRFRASPLFGFTSSYPQFAAAREGAALDLVSLKHYHFYRPLSFDPPIPVFEVIDANLKPAGLHSFPAFLSALNEVVSMISDYSGLGWTVGWQKEDPSKILVFIGWNSLEQPGEFTASGDKGWNEFISKFGPFLEKYLDIDQKYHIKTVGIGESA